VVWERSTLGARGDSVGSNGKSSAADVVETSVGRALQFTVIGGSEANMVGNSSSEFVVGNVIDGVVLFQESSTKNQVVVQSNSTNDGRIASSVSTVFVDIGRRWEVELLAINVENKVRVSHVQSIVAVDGSDATDTGKRDGGSTGAKSVVDGSCNISGEHNEWSGGVERSPENG